MRVDGSVKIKLTSRCMFSWRTEQKLFTTDWGNWPL